MQNEEQVNSIQAAIRGLQQETPNARPVPVEWLVWIRGGRIHLRPLEKPSTIAKPDRGVGESQTP